MKTAIDKALDRSGFTLADMDCFDFYSCFPCAVTIAKKMAGLTDNDPRPLTLTGGLGFFGGPGNNYNLHAVATLAEQIAGNQYRTGLVTALGWFMHKHAAGVYTSRRPEKAWPAQQPQIMIILWPDLIRSPLIRTQPAKEGLTPIP